MCVYPVLVGDIVVDADKTLYTDYFSSGCHPNCTNKVVVDSVENALQEHLNRLCFGTPLLDNMTVPIILEYIVRNQGNTYINSSISSPLLTVTIVVRVSG